MLQLIVFIEKLEIQAVSGGQTSYLKKMRGDGARSVTLNNYSMQEQKTYTEPETKIVLVV